MDEFTHWPRHTRWPNSEVCKLVNRKPTAVTQVEIKFIKKLFWACRNDPRYLERSNLEILGEIQSYLEASNGIMVGAIKQHNIPIHENII